MPLAMAIIPMTATEIMVALFPSIDFIEVMETELIPGPAIRNTSAAPGEKPFRTKATAIGTEALEQT